ncbi:MAG: hypothetical protein C5B43_04085 [Verrucomicrobia bacterium]|nr:MAG: hypothetical protein C5B43_04085 [Verrucomicrobiota bacterium]
MKLVSLLLSFLLYTVILCESQIDDYLYDKGMREENHANKVAEARDYHDRALRGEFCGKIKNTERFLTLAHLIKVNDKIAGASSGGFYRDQERKMWIVKKGQNAVNEYLGAKIMKLFVPNTPEVKLLKDAPGFTASLYIQEFHMETAIQKLINKSIVGQFELNLAMDLIGIGDRNYANMGYISQNNVFEAVRIDFDESFKHFNFDLPIDPKLNMCAELYSSNLSGKKAKRILNTPDELIFYVLGDSYNDLLTIKADFDVEHYKKLADVIIARKALFIKKSEEMGQCRLEEEAEIEDFLPNLIDDLSLTKKLKGEINTNCEFDFDLLERCSKEKRFNIINLLIEYCFNFGQENVGTLLHWAVREEKRDIVELLLKEGVDPNVRDKYGKTPLQWGVKETGYGLTKLLLEYGARVNEQDDSGHTVLHTAIEANNMDLVKLLLKNEANLIIRDVQGSTLYDWAVEKEFHDFLNAFSLLHWIIKNGDIEDLKYALEKDLNINQKDEKGRTALHLGLLRGDINVIELLLDKKADPNIQDKNGKTALHSAMEKGDLDIINLLIDNDANPNIADFQGTLPLHLAAKNGHFEVLEFIRSLTHLNEELCDQEIMHYAGMRGQWDIVKYALERGVDPNSEDRDGYSLFFWVIHYDNLELIQFLSENYFFDLNTWNLSRRPLHYAIEKGHLDIVAFLLQKKVDPNLEDEEGDTALDVAVNFNQLNVIKLLIENGVDIKRQVDEKPYLLQKPILRNQMDVFKFLLENRVNPNAKDHNGDTALDTAIFCGRRDAVQILLDFDVNIKAQDKKGLTFYEKALKSHQREIGKLIESKMKEKHFFYWYWFWFKKWAY